MEIKTSEQISEETKDFVETQYKEMGEWTAQMELAYNRKWVAVEDILKVLDDTHPEDITEKLRVALCEARNGKI